MGEMEANPYIVDLGQIGKWAFIFLMAMILLSLVIKIILDLRKGHFQ